VSQALVMTLECSRALKYGHEQGVYHGALAPNNVVFSADGHVRVVDFGLAEVLASAPASQATRALDNVRYSSPEQARGRPVTESTDLYSLALLVNEAVTGEPPRLSDTVVGTLMERAEAAADLDASLEGLLPALERCGRVNADERPEAEELSIALLAAAETMERPQALTLAGLTTPDGAGDSPLMVVGGRVVEPGRELDLADAADMPDDFDVSALGPLEDTTAFASDEPVDREAESPVALELVEPPNATVALEDLDAAEPAFADAGLGASPDDPDLDVPTRSSNRRAVSPAYEQLEDDADDRLPWWPLVVLVLLLAGAIAAGVYFFALGASEETGAVPDLVGVPFDEVATQVQARGWQLERLEGRIDGSAIGSVVSQSPIPGEELEEGETITVTVSLGNEMVEIPSDIVGLSVDQASSRLSSVGLSVGRITEEHSEGLGAGLVVGLNEPTTQKPSGQGVALRVSAGPEDRFVPPEVVGVTIGDATSLLVGLRLNAVEEPVFSPTVEAGIVLGVFPEAGAVVPADSSVTLFVSAGPEPVVMPDVVGLALDEAIDELEGLGLIFVDTEGTPGEPVIGTLPPIGATVDVGTEVLVYLDDPPEDEEDTEDDEG